MRWRLAACAALLAVVALSAQATRQVTFAWEMPTDDTGAQAEIERDGVAEWCQVQFSGQTRLCTLTVPVGPAVYRARMATVDGAWGPWSEAVTLTVPPVTPGSPPGPFTIQLHHILEAADVSLLGYTTANASGGATSVNSPSFDSGGATIIAVWLGSLDGTPVVTDNAGNTYTLGTNSNSGPFHGRWAYCLSPSTSATHVVTVSSTNDPSIIVVWFNLVSAFDSQSTPNTGASVTSLQTGSVTPANNGSLVLAALMNYRDAGPIASVSINSGFTIVTNVDSVTGTRVGVAIAYLIQGTAGAVNPSWSWSNSVDNSSAAALAFQSGSASILRQMLQQHH